MKSKITILLMTMLCSLNGFAQQYSTTDDVSQDSVINVIAYFCKNDTVGYNYQEVKYKVIDQDTTVSYISDEEFQLIVRDSTATGYLMELRPLSQTLELPNDTLMENIMTSLNREMGDISVLFTTNEYGEIQHIENWREVRDKCRQICSTFCDNYYKIHPQLDSLLPRKRFESQLNMQFSNEKAILEAFEELVMMLGYHGNQFTIGKRTVDDTSEAGYPMHTEVVAGYARTSEDQGSDQDYYIGAVSETTIPGSDVVQLTSDFVGSMFELPDSMNLEKELDKLKTNGAKVTVVEENHYFDRGWPCDIFKGTTTTIGPLRKVEASRLQWTTRRWGDL